MGWGWIVGVLLYADCRGGGYKLLEEVGPRHQIGWIPPPLFLGPTCSTIFLGTNYSSYCPQNIFVKLSSAWGWGWVLWGVLHQCHPLPLKGYEGDSRGFILIQN